MGIDHNLETIKSRRDRASLVIETLGGFRVMAEGREIKPKDWGRDKALQLMQFFVTARDRNALHKEQIVDRLWEDAGSDEAMRDLKIALHSINKALEPDRKPRQDPKYIIRQGLTYQLDLQDIWIDAEAFDQALQLESQYHISSPDRSVEVLQYATSLYKGSYIPERIYDDWSTSERERLQLLAINSMIDLGEHLLASNPTESIRLAQEALQIDNTWEEAYRLQMKAYNIKHNRPLVIKTYNQCVDVLEDAFGIQPLPETKKIFSDVMSI